jgi:hypothetical protein
MWSVIGVEEWSNEMGAARTLPQDSDRNNIHKSIQYKMIDNKQIGSHHPKGHDMIRAPARNLLFAMSAFAAIMAATVAVYGMIDQSLYRPGVPDRLMPGTFSQDLVSVFAALGLLVCIMFVRRGWNAAWLVWVGLLGFLFYAYALYSFERLYNPLYLFYIAIFGLSLYTLIGFFIQADFGSIQVPPVRTPPRRSVAALFLILVVTFVGLWLNILIPAMGSRIPPEGNTIFVLDLSFFLPLLTIEAVLLFRQAPLGDVLAIPILVKVATLGISVFIGALVAPWFGQETDLPSIGIYALLGFGPLVFIVPFLSSLTFGSDGEMNRSK